MPNIQVSLSEEENRIVEVWKAKQALKTKEDSVKSIVLKFGKDNKLIP